MPGRTMHSRFTLLILCLAGGGWAFGFGLGVPLASLWMRDAGYPARLIGLNTSIYYVGVALAAFVVPYLMRRAARLCVVGGILIDAVVTALFPWTEALPAWFALRLLGGMATAFSIIPMETLVNHNAPPQYRARDFGFYAFSVALGVALGSLVGLPLYPVAPRLAFALGGLVTLTSAVVVWFGWPSEEPIIEEKEGDGPLSLRANGLSYGTAWVQGFLEGGLITFLSIYLLGCGYSEGAVSLLVAGLFAGVILCQVPLAWLADRLGKLYVLLACHGLLIVALVAVQLGPDTPLLALSLILLGTCCGALYPLGLALLGDRVPAAELARANAFYLAINCAGSLCGPVLFGLVIDQFGQSAQFWAGSASVLAVLGLDAALKTRRKMATRERSDTTREETPRRLAG